MGYRFQNQCFETKQEFINAYSQKCQGSGGSGGLGSYYTFCTANTDTVTVQAFTLTTGAAQTPFNITPQVISCDFSAPYTNSDIIEVSWLVVGVWVVAWCLKKMAEVIKK